MFNVVIAYPAFVRAIMESFPEDSVTSLSARSMVTNDEDELLKKANLVVFSGGEDISPSFYGEVNFNSSVNRIRDRKEQSVWTTANAYKIPMLGICRGHQLLNVLYGGSLYQDIAQSFGEYHPGMHELEFELKNSIVKIAWGKNRKVNSLHHQAVKILGRNCTMTSRYISSKGYGYIESIEHPNFISTQFHPEFMETDESKLFFMLVKEWALEKQKNAN